MSRLNNALVDDIVQSCLSVYENLPKNGKPVQGEWTVLSCVMQLGGGMAALGTGSKCLGARSLAADGATLADSHAEVCARRAFLCYLYDNVQFAAQNKPSIFRREGNKFRLKDNIHFVFYSSQLPCGDASILPKNGDEEFVGEALKSYKRPADKDSCFTECKKAKLEADIHRTGAKCLPDSAQDSKLPGLEYHRLGLVRTKPGRGDPTLSVSCSDKLARWINVGIQGALLDMLCGPIFIKHFIFGGGMPYSVKSLNRALLNRKGHCTVSTQNAPEFYCSSVVFPHVKTDNRLRPAPGSMIWIKTYKTTEVAVQGKKLGLTKKQAGLSKHALCISKYKLYEKFLTILREHDDIREDIMGNCSLKDIPYNEMKRKSVRYMESWQHVKENFFGGWTTKPDMFSFCLDMI